MPNPRNGQTSVFRTSGLTERAIWLLGRNQLGLPPGRRIHGRGDVEASNIRLVTLRVEPETSTHPRHANILGWPSEEEQQKILALQLALKATLRILE